VSGGDRTEGAARLSDRGAGVSRGRSRSVPSVHSSGALAGDGRNGRARRAGNGQTEGPNGAPRGVNGRGE
jgi:hypothetical protein